MYIYHVTCTLNNNWNYSVFCINLMPHEPVSGFPPKIWKKFPEFSLTFYLTWTQISMTILDILREVLPGSWNDNHDIFQMKITIFLFSWQSAFEKKVPWFFWEIKKVPWLSLTFPDHFFPGFPWLSRWVGTQTWQPRLYMFHLCKLISTRLLVLCI